jgi:hypothetical protein
MSKAPLSCLVCCCICHQQVNLWQIEMGWPDLLTSHPHVAQPTLTSSFPLSLSTLHSNSGIPCMLQSSTLNLQLAAAAI